MPYNKFIKKKQLMLLCFLVISGLLNADIILSNSNCASFSTVASIIVSVLRFCPQNYEINPDTPRNIGKLFVY